MNEERNLNVADVAGQMPVADGSLYTQALDRILDEKERFMRAVRQEGTDEENEAAWRDFFALASRAFRSGRLWEPEIVYYLAPILHVVVAEQDELDRVDAAFKAAGDDEEAIARITSPLAGFPSFVAADALAKGLQVKPDECRRRAGYLPEDN